MKSSTLNLCEMAGKQLNREYSLIQEDIGDCSRLSKRGMTFITKSYEVEGLGHFCSMKMSAAFGLMKMETVVISSVFKDLPPKAIFRFF